MIELVRMIKASDATGIDQYLKDQDRELISQRLLASKWYPFEVFRSSFLAVVKVLAKGNMELVRQWAFQSSGRVIAGIYKNIVRPGDHLETLKRFQTISSIVFDFGEIGIEPVSSNQATITIKEIDRDFEPMCYVLIGWLEKALELSGAADFSYKLLAKSWQDSPETRIRISWRA